MQKKENLSAIKVQRCIFKKSKTLNLDKFWTIILNVTGTGNNRTGNQYSHIEIF